MPRLITTLRRAACGIGLAVLLAGCQLPAGAPEATGEEAAPEEHPLDQHVEDVAGGGVIEVSPLSDPGVSSLVDRARAAEQNGELAAAEALLGKALELAPRDPDVWQRLADLQLLAGEWVAAAAAARRSFDHGPKVGRLCVRNWLTMARAFRAQGFEERAGHAEREAEDCPVRARERL